MAELHLAVDLGKTRCRVELRGGPITTRAQGEGAPGLAHPDGAVLAEDAILAVSRPLLRGRSLQSVAVGAAGALAARASAQMLADRLCRALPARSAVVTSDVIAAHAGAFRGRPGIVLSVGTGMAIMAADRRGRLCRLDGLGFWLGDEGGGAWLGLEGLRAAARAKERRGPETNLVAAAERRYGPAPDLARRLAGGTDAPDIVAAFAADVVSAADAEDAVAVELLQDAARKLRTAVARAVHHAGGTAVPLAVVGGLAAAVIPRLLCPGPDGKGPALVAPFGTALDGARLLSAARDTIYETSALRSEAAAEGASPVDTLATEAVKPGLDDLDQRPPAELVGIVLGAEQAAQRALARAASQLAAAADAVAVRMKAGGRLIYLGAGTSGRLAMLDAIELGPTYDLPDGVVVAILAGGPGAMAQAVEGAEDDRDAAVAALRAYDLSPRDTVVGVSASGRTPFVIGGLQHARSLGALAIAIANNAGSAAAMHADLAVEILTGAEVVAGSTRMSAATTQKIALNTLSTVAMVGLGKTFGPRMVDVRATNEKLRLRALRMVRDLTGVDEAAAREGLEAAGGRVKPAVVALLTGMTAEEASRVLLEMGGRVRDVLQRTQPVG